MVGICETVTDHAFVSVSGLKCVQFRREAQVSGDVKRRQK